MVSNGGQYRLGFDIGGTFTDFVLIDGASGTVHTYKTLTTPDDPSEAVRSGWQALIESAGRAGGDVETAIHATTLITNALIERTGARTALVTTEGFADALDVGREMRYDIYDLHAPPVQPLSPRTLRFEVRERMNSFGEAIIPLDIDSLNAVVDALEAADCEAVAVCFLHSYANPSHEQHAGTVLRKRLPAIPITLSSDVAPEIREYERMSTAVANAYVQPLANRYVHQIESQLQLAGFTRRLYLMLSNGGITTTDTATRFPIRMVESGPTAGVLASVYFGDLLDMQDLVAFDMGGTTAKMCLVRNGTPELTNTFEIARVHRFKRGSGLPVRVPAVELIEIGAGGGSIARVDELGLLKIGPDSAGAAPGPACYGRGGERPTVTDANLLLGYLNPDYFLGGRMDLDVDAAQRAVERVASPLKMTVEQAAAGIHQVVNETMISATRVHIAERGGDPRQLRLIAFGGAGPLHADALARALKMPGYVCPASAGVTSALGLLTAPAAFDFARTFVAALTQERLAELDAAFSELESEGREVLSEATIDEANMRFERSADIRHLGQGHEITVDLPWPALASLSLDEIQQHFYSRYESQFGHAHRHLGIEITTCRLRASGPLPDVNLPEAEPSGDSAAARAVSDRRAFDPIAGDFRTMPVYRWRDLPANTALDGPLLVEDIDSTAYIGPDTSLTVDARQNLIVRFIEREGGTG